MPKRSTRPRDVNELAKLVLDIATGAKKDTVSESKKNPAAVALGKLGGAKGGRQRAKNLTKAKLSAIGKKGARARWGKTA